MPLDWVIVSDSAITSAFLWLSMRSVGTFLFDWSFKNVLNDYLASI